MSMRASLVPLAPVIYGDARFYRETTNTPPRMPFSASVAIEFARDKCWRMLVYRSPVRAYPSRVVVTAVNVDPTYESALNEHGFHRVSVSHAGGPRRNGPRIHMRWEVEID